MNSDRVICIDFDGVLAQYSKGWQGVAPAEPPVPGAVKFCTMLIELGYKPVVLSSRAHPGIHSGGAVAIREWLDANGFPEMEVTHEKIPAFYYIDDRAIRFIGKFGPVTDQIFGNPTGLPWERSGS